MKTKYFNDAIIGNKDMLVSLSETGELLRLYYPMRDNKQYIDSFETGVKINDSMLIYTSNDVNNEYNQKYIEDTNVLETDILNTYFKLRIVQTDFVSINENVLIRRYVFKNENDIELDTKFLIHSKLHSGENQLVSAKILEKGMAQYTHEDCFNIVSIKDRICSHQINDCERNIYTGIIKDKDYIGMSADSAICYEIGKLKPGQKKNLDIVIYVDNQIKENSKIQKIDTIKEQANTIAYWKKYYKAHNTIKLPEPKNKLDEKLNQIYKRSIMLFPLLTNEKTGAMIAAVEVDEKREKSGRYNYCWPRDAVFITESLDILGMKEEAEKFYKIFCKNTQSPNGMWEQRFYVDGSLAPSWGYQIDETASVVYGAYKHFEYTKNKKFLKETLTMCEKAIKYLKKYTEDIIEEKNKMHVKTLNPDKFLKVIEEARDNSDYVIAFVHWGTEGNNYFGSDQVSLAKQFVEAGVDVIIGGHTHCLQGMEYMDGVPIIYSLGNFWFSASTLDTGLSQVIIRDDGTIDFRFLPCIQKNYKTSLVTDESEKRRIFDFMESLSVGITIDDDGYVTATE